MTFDPPGAFPVDIRPDGDIVTLARFVWTGSRGDTVDVPAGTRSDGATRPWFTGAIVDRWGRVTRAALIHDVLCEALRAWKQQGGPAPAFTAVDADGAFRLILAELGESAVMRWLYWVGVRWGALFSGWRRAGWWRTAPAVLTLSPLALVVIGPAAVGALVSRGAQLVVELIVWAGSGAPITDPGRGAPTIGRTRRGLRMGPDVPDADGVSRYAAPQITVTSPPAPDLLLRVRAAQDWGDR